MDKLKQQLKAAASSQRGPNTKISLIKAKIKDSAQDAKEVANKNFRKYMKKLIQNPWIKAMTMPGEEDPMSDFHEAVTIPVGVRGQVFPLGEFMCKRKAAATRADITNAIKKKPHQRDRKDLTVMDTVMRSMQCFKEYSKEVRQCLAGVLWYQCLGPNRMILRAGHPAWNSYFIISGEVKVYEGIVEVENKGDVPGYTLSEGQSFGEIGVLQETIRTQTMISKGKVELFFISKDDIADVLETATAREVGLLRWAMYSEIPYFSNWTRKEVEELLDKTKFAEFEAGDVVLKVNAGQECPPFVYFVVEGICRWVRQLHVFETPRLGGGVTYTLKRSPAVQDLMSNLKVSTGSQAARMAAGWKVVTSPSDLDTRRCLSNLPIARVSLMKKPKEYIDPGGEAGANSKYSHIQKTRLTKHYVQICLLQKGHAFSIGEDLANCTIVAATPAQVMLVPRMELTAYGKMGQLLRMRDYVMERIPSEEQVFRDFCKLIQWSGQGEAMVDKVVKQRKKTLSTTSDDVSLCHRILDRSLTG